MKLKGHILENRFKIKESLSEGAFGKVYSGYDTIKREQGVRKAVIIKFSQHHQMHDKEYQTISEI
jgi:serine/threonine protein kinase